MLRETVTRKRVLIWNAAGSAVYALSSFLLLIIVIRLCGDIEGGIFSIGYAIAQLMLTVGVFESTTYFATDAGNRFTYAQYLAFKIITCALMVVTSIFYVLSFGYDIHKEAVAYALCAYRLFEALAQYWFAAFQKEERLDLSGFSTVWRSVISMLVLTILLVYTRDVVLAVVGATVSEAIWIAAYDIPRLNRVVRVGRPDFSLKPMGALFLACLPLFISSFLAAYLGNIPKYAIDNVGTEQMQTIFNVLFMPSFAINLFMIFFVRPTLTQLARLWHEHESEQFLRIIGKLLVILVAVTVVVVGVCAFIGIPLLELFYGLSLEGYLVPLLVVLLGGGFLSGANVIYNALVIIRKQNGVLVGYVVAIILALLIATPLVAGYQIIGASLAYLFSCAVLLVCFIAVFGFYFSRQVRAWRAEDQDD